MRNLVTILSFILDFNYGEYMKKYVLAIFIWIISFVAFKFVILQFKKNPEKINLAVDLTTAKDDTLQVFFFTKGEHDFSEQQSIKKEIKKSVKPQNILFEIPINLDIQQLRIDLGKNPNSPELLLNKIELSNEYNSIVFEGDSIQRFFHPNNFIVSFENGLIKYKAIGNLVDPYLTSDNVSALLLSLRKPVSYIRFSNLISLLLSTCIFIYILLQPKNFDSSNLTIFRISFSVAFICILLAPSFYPFFSESINEENLEKREKAKKPDLDFTIDYPEKFEAYYNDNFGWRSELINWGSLIKLHLFRSSINPDKVMFGKNGFMFFTDKQFQIFQSFTHTDLLSPENLQAIITNLETRKDSLNKNGIAYLLAFWPNPHTIYENLLPLTMKVQIKGKVSKADQLIANLKIKKSPVKVIDVRNTLLKARNQTQIYRKFDSHWNSYGAFLAYQSFFKQSFETLHIEPKRVEDFTILWEEYNDGDLLNMLGIQDKSAFKEPKPVFEIKNKHETYSYLSADGFPPQTVITRNETCANTKRVLIFRDSYTNALEQFYSLHFKEVFYIWTGYDQAIINTVKPDIVIEQYAERYFY